MPDRGGRAFLAVTYGAVTIRSGRLGRCDFAFYDRAADLEKIERLKSACPLGGRREGDEEELPTAHCTLTT